MRLEPIRVEPIAVEPIAVEPAARRGRAATGVRLAAAALTVVALVAGCTGGSKPVASPSKSGGASQPDRPHAAIAAPADATTIAGGTAASQLAISTSQALFHQAPAVVLAGETDDAALTRAEPIAVHLGVPLLLTPSTAVTDAGAALRTELTRLAPKTIITVGAQASAWEHNASISTPTVTVSAPSADPPASPAAFTQPSATPSDAPSGGSSAGSPPVLPSGLPDVVPAAPLASLLVLAIEGPASEAAVATAHAAGTHVIMLNAPDPRTSSDAIKALTGQAKATVLAIGSSFGSADLLRSRIAVAATGVELPGGGQVIFPGRRMVALYGHPGDTGLGALGQQSLAATITRAKQVAANYSALVQEPVIPAFEIIATVAAASAGSDGNYSNESSEASLKPWIDAAQANGIYVVLDLQPGRSDFLSQAKQYADLLAYPNVGLALDPEWHMKSNQVPMEVIGSVDSSEINKTAQWLADLTKQHNLPQKVLMLHQFRLDMITNRSKLETDFDQLQIVIHADGFGSTPQKFNTWNTLHINPPANVIWGWKNFLTQDKPTLTPQQTMAVKPTPFFVSYQ
jgi:hypothetical protein